MTVTLTCRHAEHGPRNPAAPRRLPPYDGPDVEPITVALVMKAPTAHLHGHGGAWAQCGQTVDLTGPTLVDLEDQARERGWATDEMWFGADTRADWCPEHARHEHDDDDGDDYWDRNLTSLPLHLDPAPRLHAWNPEDPRYRLPSLLEEAYQARQQRRERARGAAADRARPRPTQATLSIRGLDVSAVAGGRGR